MDVDEQPRGDGAAAEAPPRVDLGAVCAQIRSGAGDGRVVLNGVGIGDDEARAIFEAVLSSNGSVHTIELERNCIGDDACKAIAEAAIACPGLHMLYLGRNRIGDDGAVELASALEQTWETELSFFLQRNRIGPHGRHALEFAGALRSIRQGKCSELRLDGHALDAAEVAALAGALAGSTCVRQLYLRRCGLGDDGAAAIASALAGNSTVRQVRLSENGIGDVGARALIRALAGGGDEGGGVVGGEGEGGTSGAAAAAAAGSKGSCGVWRVDLGENALTDAVAPDLVGMLGRNAAVSELDVSANALTVRGMMAFVDVLAETPTRVTLDGNDDDQLDNVVAYAAAVRDVCSGDSRHVVVRTRPSFLGDEGFRRLLGGLAGNGAVESITFPPDEHLSDASAGMLADLLRTATALRRVSLPGRPMRRMSQAALATVVEAMLFQPVDRVVDVGGQHGQFLLDGAREFGPPAFLPHYLRPPAWRRPLSSRNRCAEHPLVRRFWLTLLLCRHHLRAASARPDGVPRAPPEVWDMVLEHLRAIDVVPMDWCQQAQCRALCRVSAMVTCSCRSVRWCSEECRSRDSKALGAMAHAGGVFGEGLAALCPRDTFLGTASFLLRGGLRFVLR